MALIVLFLLAFIALWVLFVIPTIIAFKQGHPNRWAILVVNIALGGTGIGWLAALFWSLRLVHVGQPGQSSGGRSGLNIFADDVRSIRLVDGDGELLRADMSSSKSAVAQLERLVRLRDAAHITEQEFHRMKVAVLLRS